jgi:hypothetical protein
MDRRRLQHDEHREWLSHASTSLRASISLASKSKLGRIVVCSLQLPSAQEYQIHLLPPYQIMRLWELREAEVWYIEGTNATASRGRNPTSERCTNRPPDVEIGPFPTWNGGRISVLCRSVSDLCRSVFDLCRSVSVLCRLVSDLSMYVHLSDSNLQPHILTLRNWDGGSIIFSATFVWILRGCSGVWEAASGFGDSVFSVW